MSRRVRDMDWAATPLGDYATWPEALVTLVRLLLASKQAMFVNWGPERILLYNDAYGAILGSKHPTALGRPVSEVWVENWSDIALSVDRVYAGHAVQTPDLSVYLHRNGAPEEAHFAFSYTPVLAEGGEVQGLFCVCTETTPQILKDRHERKVRMRLEAAIEVARLGTFEWFPATGLVDLDARSREIFDAPNAGEVQATDIFSRVAPEDFDRVVTRCTEIVERASRPDADPLGERISLDYDFLRTDGSRCAISSSGVVFQGEDGTWRMLGAIADATEIKRAEATIRHERDQALDRETAARADAERVQLALAAGAILGTWFWDPITDLFTVDDGFAATFSLDPMVRRGEVKLAHIMEALHPDDRAGLAAAIDEAVGRGGAYVHQYRTRRADGRYYWLEAIGRVDLAPDGTPLSFPGVFVDIEERRAVEAERARVAEELHHINETLEQRVAERTVELMQAEEALRQSQKMEAVGQLTGGLAHDFNNLLAGISGSLEMMQSRMQQGRFNDVERYMAAAQGASKRAAALTHRLLAFSRRQTLDPKPTDVNRLVGGMQEMIQRTVGPGIPVEVVGASGLWPALVDPPQLENALLNLCINARDAMPDGGRITVETHNKWIDGRASAKLDLPEGQYLSLCVTDTGTGMPPEVIARVFEPFFTTKPIGEGTGLGLSMIYGFAQQSGGQVRIYSEVGQGSTICIYLPRHYGEVDDEATAAKLEVLPPTQQGATVLVVDDESTVRMLVTDILEDLGYLAIEASDSAAGLKVLQSDVRIDLLVTDVGLPGGMNGRQMADAGRVKRPDLRVLFITGYAENAILGNGHLAPGMAVLTKPFAMDAMAARIRSLIEAGREAKR